MTRAGDGGTRRGSNGGEHEGLASALGWFSIGLGLAQIVAPGGVARLIGISDSDRSRNVMRALGMREIASGVGILSTRQTAQWMWGRVAGDAMDLALLGRSMSSDESERGRTSAATAAVLGVAALDAYCAQQLTRERRRNGEEEAEVRVPRAVTVNRPVEEVYRFWRDFENFPRFMRHVESVQDLGNGRSHWKASAPAGTSVEWDAELVEDVPNERISWRSIEGSEVENRGTVHFRPAPQGRGTEVIVELEYEPPAGKLGQLVAKIFREEPGEQVFDDLRSFKQVLETGEVLLSDATLQKGPHPAHPPGKLGDRVSAKS